MPGLLGLGLATLRSVWSFRETVARLEHTARQSGADLFARIDHDANAKQLGLALPPSELLLLGKPAVSTPLMQDRPSIGVDLPMRVLVWRDHEGIVWVTHNDIAFIGLRHGVERHIAIGALHDWFDRVIASVTTSSNGR